MATNFLSYDAEMENATVETSTGKFYFEWDRYCTIDIRKRDCLGRRVGTFVFYIEDGELQMDQQDDWRSKNITDGEQKRSKKRLKTFFGVSFLIA